MKKIKSISIIICLLCIFLIPAKNLNAASLKLKIGKASTSYYKGKQINVTINGSSINMHGTKGILLKGYSMVPYDIVFRNGLKAGISYNKKTGYITIRRYDNVVKLKLNSKTAYINNKKTKAPVAPVSVYYSSLKKRKILIPSRFTAQALGYHYTWNSASSTIKITSPYAIRYNGSWHVYHSTQCNASLNEKKVDLDTLPVLIFNNNAMVPAEKIFNHTVLETTYDYNKKKKTITISKGQNTLIYTLDSKTVLINNVEHTITVAPKLVKDNRSLKTQVMVPGRYTAEKLGLQYKWNSTTKTSSFAQIDYSPDNIWKWQNPNNSENLTDNNCLLSTVARNSKGNESFHIFTQKDVQPEISYSSDNHTITIILSNKIEDLVETNITTPNDTIENNEEVNPIKSMVPDSNNFENTSETPIINENNIDNSVMNQNEFTPSIINESSIEGSNIVEKVLYTQENDNTYKITLNLNKEIEFYEINSGNEFFHEFCIFFATKTVTVSSNTVTLEKPLDVLFEEIKDEDLYEKKQFKIIIPGNYLTFYQSVFVPNQSKITSVICELNADGDTVLTFETSSIQAYRLSYLDNTITIEIDDPGKMYKNIIVMDPGHGGKDPGAIAHGYYEKTLTYNIFYKYAKDLFNSPQSPIKVYWTRTDDSYKTLSARAAFAKNVDADFFVSLHLNSATSTAKGAETFYCKSNNTVNTSGVSSKILANYFQYNWPSSLGISTSRGVKTANYYVLKYNKVPSILVELGFISNSHDISILKTTANQKKAASYFYNAVCDFFESYPTNR